MVDRVLGEETAGGQAGVPGADDDRGDAFDDSALPFQRLDIVFSAAGELRPLRP